MKGFFGRHDIPELDTIEQMRTMRGGMEGQRLTYQALIKNNDASSSTRADAWAMNVKEL